MPSPYKLGLACCRTMNVLEVCNKKLMIIVIKHTISDTFGIFACVILRFTGRQIIYIVYFQSILTARSCSSRFIKEEM